MRTKNIRQVVTIKAGPRSVYEALMDSRKHAKFTGGRASISRKVGGRIRAYDGYIDGINIELVRDRKIAQAWRGSDWPEGYFSKSTFTLTRIRSGTRLTFTQVGVPEEHYEAVRLGWIEHYWDKMKKMLEA